MAHIAYNHIPTDDKEEAWGVEFERLLFDEITEQTLIDIVKNRAGGVAVRTHKKKYRTEATRFFNVTQIRGGRRPLSYNNIYCGFDIETTRIDERTTFMYTWQFSIFNYVIHGTTWEDFITLLGWLKANYWSGKDSNKLVVWVANLGYEWQFMKHYLTVTDYFFKERRDPVYIEHDNFIVFRECLSWGGSLAKLASDYTPYRKLKGDLYYAIYRESYKDFTNEQEWLYCDLDVLILSAFSEWFFNTYFKEKINPVTIQSFLRIESRREIEREGGNLKKVQQFIRANQPNKLDYDILMNYVYRGGYVHGNILYTGEEFKDRTDLFSVDFTSSYPASMLHYKYPLGFVYYPEFSYENLAGIDLANNTYYACFEFKNLSTTTAHAIESLSKCIECDGKIIDNGRVRKAQFMKVYLTSLDFELYRKFYKWDDVKAYDVHVAPLHKLPDYLLKPMLKYYTAKAVKKKAGEPYAIEKSYCNSYYGVCVTRKPDKEVEWDGQDTYNKLGKTYEELIKRDIFLPQWGVWISAYSRYNLLYNVWEIEHQPAINGRTNIVLYCDTDSIKFIDSGNAFDVVNRYNANMYALNKALCERYELDYEFYEDLGAFENEYKDGIIDFKMLGAKRYIHSYMKNGKKKYVATVAGLPKTAYTDLHSKDAIDFLTHFVDKLDVKDCKLASHFEDEPTTYKDRAGVTHVIKSSVTLNEVDFTMKLDTVWLQLIHQVVTGKHEARIWG